MWVLLLLLSNTFAIDTYIEPEIQLFGSMNYKLLNKTYENHLLLNDILDDNSQIIFFKRVYKRYTDFALEYTDAKNGSNFGQEYKIDFMINPLYTHSVPKVILRVVLPPIYIDNTTSGICKIIKN